MSEIRVQYRDESITYNESANEWRWQGSQRGLISLEAARKSIDRAIDGAADKPKFEKQRALFKRSYDRDWVEVDVTSQDGSDFWISQEETGRGGRVTTRRSKEDSYSLQALTPQNQQKIVEIKELETEIEKLESKVNRVKESMQSFADWLIAKHKSTKGAPPNAI